MFDEEYETDQDGNLQMVKSIDCEHPSYLRFTNVSKRTIEVLWVNYEGRLQKYRTLRAHQFVDVNTFTTHPWVFKDAVTLEKHVVDNKIIFRGKRQRQVYSAALRENPRPHNIRVKWNITPPLRDLRSSAMIVLSDLISHYKYIKLLDLPKTLKIELLYLLVKRNQIVLPEDFDSASL